MKTSRKEITVTKAQTVTVYTAFDGTEFTDRRDCENYEENQKDKRIAESPDVVESADARERMPFDGHEYYENHEFRWFKPLNEKGVELLCKLFDCELGSGDIGNWVCLEISEDYTYTSGLNSCIDYVKDMCGIFGIDAEFHERKG